VGGGGCDSFRSEWGEKVGGRGEKAEVHMQRKTRGKIAGTTISIRLVQQFVGCETVRRFLVIHAVSGCDTTSAVFGHGKMSAFKTLSANSLGHLCDAVSSSESSQSDVGHAGCELIVALYGGTLGVESLDKLRYTTYMKLCSSSKMAIIWCWTSGQQLTPCHPVETSPWTSSLTASVCRAAAPAA